MSKYLKAIESTFTETAVKISERYPNQPVIRADRESLQSIAQHLKDTIGFDHAISVTIIDDIENSQFLIAYHLSSVQIVKLHGIVLTLEVTVPRASPRLPSLILIWPSVEFHEREGWEMFGVEFEGHPRLERLLLPESWEGGNPLRKDFRLPEDSQ
ncbi:MAG: NADH-quinone oxidoreductase subunit C [Promethearchaeota archaeon]